MIWKKKIEIKKINENQSNTMAEFLNIIVTDVGKDFIKANSFLEYKNCYSSPVKDGFINLYSILFTPVDFVKTTHLQ